MAFTPITSVSPAPALTPAGGAALGPRSFGAVLEARATIAVARSQPPPTLPSTALRGLEAIERAQARLDGLLAAARSGRTFTPQELLALQGDAYRYAQTVELAAKLVEQGAQAVKQALHAQV